MSISTPVELLRGVLQWQNWTAQDFPARALKQNKKTNKQQQQKNPTPYSPTQPKVLLTLNLRAC